MNAAANNYQLTTLSPAFNSGTNLTSQGVTMDIVGVSRPSYGKLFDRGAYELPSPPGSVILLR